MNIIRFFIKQGIYLISILAVVFLILPTVVVALFSFNQQRGRFNYHWNGFSLAAWRHVCWPAGLCSSIVTSLILGVCATVIATIVGVFLAFSIVRYRVPGSRLYDRLLFTSLATPDVVMAASLLALFINIGIPLGFWTVLISHITFMISYVVTVVKARLIGDSGSLEKAAMDLYATPWQAFLHITLPHIAPGVAAAAVVALSLSFDDFIITNFNSGNVQTFPVYVWGAQERGVPPQVNVIATIFFAATLVGVLAWACMRSKRQRASP